MQPGDTIAGHTLDARLPGPTGARVSRWRASAPDGATVEILAPIAADDAAAFRRAHESLDEVGATLLEGPVVVRPSPGDASLAEISGPQAPAIVAAIGLTLLQALDALPEDSIDGLDASDIRLDDAGLPRLAPAGLASATGRDPGGARGAEAARWGLGRILFALATGSEPVERPGRPGPPRARDLRPDLPEPLDRAIAALLDRAAGSRASARADLHDVAGPLPDLHRLRDRQTAPSRASTAEAETHRSSRLGQVQVTTSASDRPSARLDVPPLRTALLVSAEHAASLSPSERSAAAGVLGLTERAVREIVADGLPLPLAVDLRGPAAEAAARDLPLDTQSIRAAGALPAVGAAAAGLTGAVGLAAALVLAVPALLSGAGVALLAVPAILGLVSALFIGLAVILGLTWMRQRSAWTGVDEAHRRILEARRILGPDPTRQRLLDRLAQARRAIAAADLPELAERDLRDALGALESGLDEPVEPDRVDAVIEELDTLTGNLARASDAATDDPEAQVSAGLDRLRRTRALLTPDTGGDDPARTRAARAAARTREPG